MKYSDSYWVGARLSRGLYAWDCQFAILLFCETNDTDYNVTPESVIGIVI